MQIIIKVLVNAASGFGNVWIVPRSCKHIQIHGFNGNICIQDRCPFKASKVKHFILTAQKGFGLCLHSCGNQTLKFFSCLLFYHGDKYEMSHGIGVLFFKHNVDHDNCYG